jgi:hypothetical protein
MTRNYEAMSDNIKSFDWTQLAPGEYKLVNDKFVLADISQADVDAAADNFLAALRGLKT